jgi:LPXTG-motif cell wall-anchored protein
VKRVAGIARSRAGRLGLVAGVAVATVVGFAAPAFAHHTSVRGSVECSNGDHLVHWDIQNDEIDQPMTIVSATASVGNQNYPVVGYTSPVANGDFTSATTTVPNAVGGTITLTVTATWPDEYTVTNSASVDLQPNCCEGTTTTTEATTTTTQPVTTTTAATTTTTEATTTTTQPVTTTSMRELGSTTIVTTTTVAPTTTLKEQGSTVPPTTQPPAPAQLPRTGSSTTFPLIFGLSSLAAGSLLLVRKPRAWSRP